MNYTKSEDANGNEIICFYPEQLKSYIENQVTLIVLKDQLKAIKELFNN